MTDITNRSIYELAEALSRGDFSSRELTEAYLESIHRKDPSLGAYLTVTPEDALLAADESDARRAKGDSRGILDGIPFAVKDNLCTKGIRTTCGSRFLENYVPPYDATAILRLKNAGAVLLGKLNMDEFGMGSSTEYSAFHLTKNPLDPSRVAGGSSGGSAAAVCASLTPFSLGSDTGGSVRQPAAFCGLVGIKPTYGTVSRYGLVAYASSLDQIGTITKTPLDGATVLQAIAGADPMDATTLRDATPTFSSQLSASLGGMRIGVCRRLPDDPYVSADVKNALTVAAKRYEELGASLVEVNLPAMESALAAYYVLSAAEASSNLARFDGVRFGKRAVSDGGIDELYLRSRSEGFGTEVKRRILLGTFALSAGYAEQYYENACRARQRLMADFDAVFSACDLLLIPTAPSVAFTFGRFDGAPEEKYRQDLYTVPASLAGLPALSLPFGTGEQGLPVGLQLVGPRRSEPRLLGAASALMREGGAI